MYLQKKVLSFLLLIVYSIVVQTLAKFVSRCVYAWYVADTYLFPRGDPVGTCRSPLRARLHRFADFITRLDCPSGSYLNHILQQTPVLLLSSNENRFFELI